MLSIVLIDSMTVMLRQTDGAVNLAGVARTRASSRLSTAGLAGVAAARLRWEVEPIPDQESQLAADGHRLPEVGPERIRSAPPVAHSGTYHYRYGPGGQRLGARYC